MGRSPGEEKGSPLQYSGLGHKELDTTERLSLFHSFSFIKRLFSSSSLSAVRVSRLTKVAQLCPTLCDSMDYTLHEILQARILEWVAFPFSRGSSQPRSPTWQAASLPDEPQEKPKNTGVGSLSFFQWIFPTQESNWGLLHCKQILYQLSYQGSPNTYEYNLIWK